MPSLLTQRRGGLLQPQNRVAAQGHRPYDSSQQMGNMLNGGSLLFDKIDSQLNNPNGLLSKVVSPAGASKTDTVADYIKGTWGDGTQNGASPGSFRAAQEAGLGHEGTASSLGNGAPRLATSSAAPSPLDTLASPNPSDPMAPFTSTMNSAAGSSASSAIPAGEMSMTGASTMAGGAGADALLGASAAGAGAAGAAEAAGAAGAGTAAAGTAAGAGAAGAGAAGAGAAGAGAGASSGALAAGLAW